MHHLKILFIILIAFLLNSCEKENCDEECMRLERMIRKNNDPRATFSWHQYHLLLEELKKDRYEVIPVHLMSSYDNPDKIAVCMRHDVDIHIFKALEMALIEQSAGIRSTYFILATAPYYGEFKKGKIKRHQCMESYYREIADMGHEIGIHNDLLTVMIQEKTDPYLFNLEELDFYRSLGIPIYGTAAHGSEIAGKTVRNYEIFSDFAKNNRVHYGGKEYPIGTRSLRDYGFSYESYFVGTNKYYSDLEGKWQKKYRFDYILEMLRSSEPGDRVQILTHPVWWGK